MADRDTLIAEFLSGTDWASATRAPLAGDASNRRYERLRMDDYTAVLMDAPPDRGEDVRPFVRIAEYLTGIGLSAPRILAQDTTNGFLILEDLGDALYARVLERQPELETRIYAVAVDALIALHRADPPELEPYDPTLMTDLAALALTRYAAGITGQVNDDHLEAFRTIFMPLLQGISTEKPVLIQRDYHAENLLWLPNRDGVARVGLLDFQDAMMGHPAYDLVSVLQDARRDVPADVEEAMIARYLASMDRPEATFRKAYAIVGAQRNLRILGVFARLCLDHGKPHYVDLIPRVWGLLQRDLAHPALAEVAALLADSLPEPSPETLSKLRPA